MIFDPENPREGAEKLLKWAWDGLAFRENVSLPSSLSRKAVREFCEHLEFVGDGLRFPLCFGLAAVAKDEIPEGEYQIVVAELYDALPSPPRFPRPHETHFYALIAIGIAADHSFLKWIEDLPDIPDDQLLPFLSFVFSLGDGKLIEKVRILFPEQSSDLKRPKPMESPAGISTPEEELAKLEPLDGCYSTETDTLMTGLMVAIVESRMEDASEVPARAGSLREKCFLLLNLIRGTRLSKKDSGPIEVWLRQTEELLGKIEPDTSLYEDFEEGRGYLEKIFRIESFCHRGDDEGAGNYVDRLLKQYQEAEAEGINYDEREGILGALCEFLAASGQYEQLIPLSQNLDAKGSFPVVVGRLFRHWNPTGDVPRLLSLTRKESLEKDEFGCVEDYLPRRLLVYLIQNLAEKGDSGSDDLAQKVADHLLTEFEDRAGIESLASAYLERGEFERARELGGGIPPYYKTFFSERNVDYLRAVRDWERDPEILTHLALKGFPREAVQHILTAIVKSRSADWLHKDYYLDKPEYRREYLPLCEWALDEARDRIALDRKGDGRAPGTGAGFRFFRLVIGGMARVVRSIEGRAEPKAAESRKERDQRKIREREEHLAEKLKEAGSIQEREERWRILRELPDKCRFVNRNWGDQYIDQSALREALRAEIQVMRAQESAIEPHRAGPEWAQLAGMLLESFDVEGACEAWRDYEKYAAIPPSSSEALVGKARVGEWHQVAPFCGTNPRSSAMLAAKLFCWFPGEKIPYPRKVGI